MHRVTLIEGYLCTKRGPVVRVRFEQEAGPNVSFKSASRDN